MSNKGISVTPRLITFNCLSPHYANEEWFPGVNMKFMDELYRKNKFMQLMTSFFKVNFVIAIQELCEEWSLVIRKLCEENGYNLEYRSYSDGKMGVGIAYPYNHYAVLKSDFYCPPLTVRNRINRMRSLVESVESDKTANNDRITPLHINAMKLVVNDHDQAENKEFKNIMVTLLLRCLSRGVDTGKELLVSTYHMPCRFNQERYMICQAHEIVSRMTKLTRIWSTADIVDRQSYSMPTSISTIFMGDCNIHPKSYGYGILTGTFGIASPVVIQNVIVAYRALNIDFNDVIKFRSAHYVSEDTEPEYTNVKFKDPTNPSSINFLECLDYILISPNVGVKSVQVGLTPKEGSPLRPYPNAICPSDHLPLSASLIV